MKKLISTICAALTAALLTTPALADILPIPFPDPNPEEMVPQIPDVPTVTAAEPASMLVPVLACAVIVIAAAVLARTILLRRRRAL